MGVVRLILLSAAILVLLVVGAVLFDPTRGQDPADAVRAALREEGTAEALAAAASRAVRQDAYDDVLLYADVARFANLPVDPEIETYLARESGEAAAIARGTGEFVGGFVTGDAASASALAGAVASDLTVIGDVRDIATEGSRWVQNQPYNELVLGLSVVGVALTATTIATGGGALPAKVGVSVLKVSRRAGTLTAEFASMLSRLVREAVDPPGLKATLRGVKLTDPGATRLALEGYARQVRTASLFPLLSRLEEIREAAGAGEAVKLMRHVKTADDLTAIARLSKVLGPKTRGVVELTGKTSLRAFKGGLNMLTLVIENVLAFLSWLGSLAGLVVSRQLLRGLGF